MRYVFLLNTIILTLLAQPAWAETVYYCTSDTPETVKDDLVTKHPPERFKMMKNLSPKHRKILMWIGIALWGVFAFRDYFGW